MDYIDFNNDHAPLGYLITFRSYGTWLHGDTRGSIDRFHNRYRSQYIEPNQKWDRHNVQILEGEPVVLDGSQRHAVDRAIRETCTFRKWHLHALSVRTNHVHVVTAIGLIPPERALSAFKANATRQMTGWLLATRIQSLGGKRKQEIFVERAKR